MKTIYSKESIEEHFEKALERAKALGKYGPGKCREVAIATTADHFGMEVDEVLEALGREEQHA